MFAETVELMAAFEAVEEYWSPRVVAQVNDQYVKVAKLRGEFTWHAHEHEDELFYVVKGSLTIRYEDRNVVLAAGSMHVVRRGVRHNPLAEEECWIVLIEPVATKHTGDTVTALTRSVEEQLR